MADLAFNVGFVCSFELENFRFNAHLVMILSYLIEISNEMGAVFNPKSKSCIHLMASSGIVYLEPS